MRAEAHVGARRGLGVGEPRQVAVVVVHGSPPADGVLQDVDCLDVRLGAVVEADAVDGAGIRVVLSVPSRLRVCAAVTVGSQQVRASRRKSRRFLRNFAENSHDLRLEPPSSRGSRLPCPSLRAPAPCGRTRGCFRSRSCRASARTRRTWPRRGCRQPSAGRRWCSGTRGPP